MLVSTKVKVYNDRSQLVWSAFSISVRVWCLINKIYKRERLLTSSRELEEVQRESS